MRTYSFLILLSILSNVGCNQQSIGSLDEVRIYIPNIIFTDSESDNILYAKTFLEDPSIEIIVVNMEVYDRSGNLLFKNEQFPPNERAQGWNGKVDGNPVEQGSYTYFIEITDGLDNISFRDDFSVFR